MIIIGSLGCARGTYLPMPREPISVSKSEEKTQIFDTGTTIAHMMDDRIKLIYDSERRVWLRVRYRSLHETNHDAKK